MEKISFAFQHGNIEAVYKNANNPNTPLVIITNGHNGFYNYGMFPYIQIKLADKGISSLSYNFSHGGIEGDSDYFTHLDLYEKNCMRLETADLTEITRHLSNSGIKSLTNKIVLLGHSMGSVPVIFAAKELLSEGYPICGLILLSPISTLDRWDEETMKLWETTGVRMIMNNRTKQDLPHGKEFLTEVREANGKWSIHKALKDVDTNLLLVHGDNDEAVLPGNSVDISRWNKEYGHNTTLKIIHNAGHTFNTRHPFTGPSIEVDQMITEISTWILTL